MAKNSGSIPSLAQLTNGTPQYLHSLPGTSNGYVISLDSNGSVNVAVGTAAATVFSDTSGCVGSF